jgi:Kazal-type serine protease inhibitor domain
MLKSVGLGIALASALVIGMSGTAGAKVGAKCGGFAGPTCGPHEFCERPTGICFFPDIEGSCVQVPTFCYLSKKASAVVIPVCGCDGKTYSNDCLRMKAKVSKAHDGACAF